MNRILTEASQLLGKDIVLAHGKDIKEGDGIQFTSVGEGVIDYRHYSRLLEENEYEGAMILHGIETEAKVKSSAQSI